MNWAYRFRLNTKFMLTNDPEQLGLEISIAVLRIMSGQAGRRSMKSLPLFHPIVNTRLILALSARLLGLQDSRAMVV